MRPHTITTDTAAIYPPALAAVLSEVEPVAGKLDQQAIERDHLHRKGRYRVMRGFKQPGWAQIVCTGHGLMRNLRGGFYRLGVVSGPARHDAGPLTAGPCVIRIGLGGRGLRRRWAQPVPARLTHAVLC